MPVTAGQEAQQPTVITVIVIQQVTATATTGPAQVPPPQVLGQEQLVPTTGEDFSFKPPLLAGLPLIQKMLTYMGLMMVGAAVFFQGLSRKH